MLYNVVKVWNYILYREVMMSRDRDKEAEQDYWDNHPKEKKFITLERIKNIVIDIKDDDEWVNDSQTQAEYKGVCDGLDMLVNHLEVIQRESNNE
jgi:hypothetical protein